MGQEIQNSHFTAGDFQQFQEKLREETNLLGQWFQEGRFLPQEEKIGFELEAWLVDHHYQPAPKNDSLLESLSQDNIVPELSRYNLEINSQPHLLAPDFLLGLKEELEKTWQRCQEKASRIDSEVLMIGTLPTLKEEMLNLSAMSPMERYQALNEQVMRLRGGDPLALDIHGRDRLQIRHNDVMLESAGTSLQIHLQVDTPRAVRFFNSALILAAPLVALAANSPYLFGKELWEETRIPLFEQSVDLWSFDPNKGLPLSRVSLGTGFVENSLYECFLENVRGYPVLLPFVQDTPPEQLAHLRLHNGTIWRWVRPLVETGRNGRPHLRLEHRVAASGPSIVDVLANMAFLVGTLYSLALQADPPEGQITFYEARDNFYLAAKEGLDAQIRWLNGRMTTIHQLLEEHLLPLAEQGLKNLNIPSDQIDYYLKSILGDRVKSGQNGAAWQRGFVQRYGRDLSALTAAYAQRQESGLPVHQWGF